ncbi:MAG: hypothetical protein HOP28_02165 [Gemmatimonadales bacterium]|nr:hypothetical protein [Gemmatimonadales bacterium]
MATPSSGTTSNPVGLPGDNGPAPPCSRRSRITTWGFTDRHSWIPAFFAGSGRALPLDLNSQPKSVMNSLQRSP